MKRTCVTVIVALLLGIGAGSAQGQTTVLSETTWGGGGRDAPGGVVVAVDGSSYVTGTTDSFTVDQFGTPSPRIFLVKFTPGGAIAWQKIWSGVTITGLHGPVVALDPGAQPGNAADDSVYVAGLTVTNTNNGIDAVLLKFDAVGTLLWQRTWGGLDGEESGAVATAPDGSVYIAGSTTSFAPNGDIFVVKFSAAGAMLWQKIADGSGNFAALAVAPDGSVYAAGNTARDPQFSQFDLVVLKITPAGTLTWQRTYAAGDDADARGGMTVAPDGSIYISGALQTPKMGFVPISALVIRLSADGALLYDGQWGSPGSEAAGGIAAGPDSSIYFAGTTPNSGAGFQDAFVVHLLTSGKIAGTATWGGSGFDQGAGVALAADGTLRLAAIADAPPYSLLPAAKRMSNVKGSLAVATTAFGDAFGTAADAGGVVTTPAGSTTFAGNVDAALVRLAP